MAKSEAETLASVSAAQLAAQVANWAAQLEFQKERQRLLELPEMQARIRQGDQSVQIQIEQLAFQKAQAAWQQAIQEASVTGTYKGQPTIEWLTQQAQITGVLNGQQTLQGKLTDAQIAQMNAAMANDGRRIALEEDRFQDDKQRFGLQFAYQQQQDRIANRFKEADITGQYNGQDTLARQQMLLNYGLDRQRLGLQGAELLASLQGNPFKTARVLGATPNGLDSLLAAWAGDYQLPSSTGSGMAPGAPTIADLYDPFGTGTPMAPIGTIPGVGGPLPTTAGGGALTPGEQARFDQIFQRRRQLAAAGEPDVSAQDLAELQSYLARGARPTGAFATPTAPLAAGGQQPVPAGGVAEPMMHPGGTVNFDESGNGYYLRGGAPAGESGYTYSPPGTQAPVDAYNYTYTPSGSTQVHPPGTPAPAQDPQVSTTAPQTPGYANRRLLPNQINAENYGNTNKALQNAMWQYFEDEQGWAPGAAQDAFARSLPKYGGPSRGMVGGLGF